MKLFAHRGYHINHPENTTGSIEHAVQNGISGIEIDIRKCKTGEIVLYHDRNLKRLTGYNKFVIRTPYDTINQLNIKCGGKEYKIADFQNTLKTYGSEVLFILDIKKETWLGDSLERNIIDIVTDLKLSERIIYSSFNQYVLKKIHRINPDTSLGLILWHPVQLKFYDISLLSSIHVNYLHLPDLDIDRYRERNIKIFVWTLNDESICEQILGTYSIDGIISDNPVGIKNCLEKNGITIEN